MTDMKDFLTRTTPAARPNDTWNQPHRCFWDSDGLKFQFRDEGQGLPFVFQHGLGGDRQSAVRTLSARDWAFD